MIICSIETSCDETAIAIAEFSGSKKRPALRVLSHIVSSQVKLHAKFGGVVPNLAKREHEKNLVPILLRALTEARFSNSGFQNPNYKQKQKSKIQKLEKILEREQELLKKFKKYIMPLQPPPVDAIAVTEGPGLAPALWVGLNFAKALSALWNKPIVPVNHMAGHLYSALIQKKSDLQPTAYNLQPIAFPAIALLVSGGHTELVLMKSHENFRVVGETLGLGYPGGPAISALAEMEIPISNFQITKKFKIQNSKKQLKLPRPMINSKDYNFSFSGLKTAVLYFLQGNPEFLKSKRAKSAVAREFQNAVVDVLISKTIRAANEHRAKTVLLGGGVAANELLRKRLDEFVARDLPHATLRIPRSDLTGDNALMIALAAYFGKKKPMKNLQKVAAYANLRLS